MNELNKVSLKGYSAGDRMVKRNILIRITWFIVNNVFFRSYIFPGSKLKRFLLICFKARVGKGLVIKPGVNIKYPWLLEIGDYVWIGEGVWIDNLTNIIIGDNGCISQGAMLLTGNHNYKKSSFDLILGEIILEDGVWIGAKCIVGPGVVCGTHSVLTMGSIAVRNMDAYSVYQGNPAQKTKTRKIED